MIGTVLFDKPKSPRSRVYKTLVATENISNFYGLAVELYQLYDRAYVLSRGPRFYNAELARSTNRPCADAEYFRFLLKYPVDRLRRAKEFRFVRRCIRALEGPACVIAFAQTGRQLPAHVWASTVERIAYDDKSYRWRDPGCCRCSRCKYWGVCEFLRCETWVRYGIADV